MSLAYDTHETPVLAKYDPLLAKAISRLPQATAELRREIYARARLALETQLRALKPSLPETVIADEERALNEAIQRVEASVTDNRSSAALEEQVHAGEGWLARLLKLAPLDSEPETPEDPPLSAMDFAPKRARQNEMALRSQVVSLPGFKSDGPEPSPTPEYPEASAGDVSAILRKLHEEALGVEASALISSSGSIIASALSVDMEESRIAGMAATLKTIGARAATHMARGAAREVIIHGEEGYAVLISTDGGGLLLTLTDRSSKLGAIFSRMYEAIKQLGDGDARACSNVSCLRSAHD